MSVQPAPEAIAALTPRNPFERSLDGRPRIPDDLLERLRRVTTEEAWGVLREYGYPRQFEGGWLETHPGRITVGRAVTARFLPHRPDLHEAVQQAGEADGRSAIGLQNSWIIESLQPGDVMVVDIFGKVKDGTVVGDNLGTAVRSRTRAGAVIDGGVRDYQGLMRLEDVNFYVRGVDPTAIADVTLDGINVPIRIGAATVLPGDAVLGTPTGVTFIPPHLVTEVVERAEETRIRDEFGKGRLAEGRYTTGEMDVSPWREEIEADFQAWRAANGR